jgi:hypothetical protein
VGSIIQDGVASPVDDLDGNRHRRVTGRQDGANERCAATRRASGGDRSSTHLSSAARCRWDRPLPVAQPHGAVGAGVGTEENSRWPKLAIGQAVREDCSRECGIT